jgi:chemotaxis protein CheZ
VPRSSRPYRFETLGRTEPRRSRLGLPPASAREGEAGDARAERSPGSPFGPAQGHQAAAAAVVQAGAGLDRASAELTAVINDVGRGVHAILGVCEDLDAAIHRLKAEGALAPEAADQLSEKVVLLFQACDFQDLSGQRLTNVRGLLQELDRRIATWRFGAGPEAQALAAARPRIPGWSGAQSTDLENGPRLQSDAGHLTQAEVDRLLS